MGTRQADRPVKQIKMKFALLISALVASTFAAPKANNDLTCSICVDVITDIDEFITDTTTEDQIIAFFKEICHRSLTTSSTTILILTLSVPTLACVHKSIFS